MEYVKKVALIEQMDESTSLSWLWCAFFGPFWFLYIGAYGWAVLSLFLALVTAGLSSFVVPFFAYKAHKQVATARVDKIEKLQIIDELLAKK